MCWRCGADLLLPGRRRSSDGVAVGLMGGAALGGALAGVAGAVVGGIVGALIGHWSDRE